MNFYKRHLGDIAKGCAHLSQGQMGAYDLLLDWLYGNERPLPPDKADLYRIGRASSKQERDNVDRVIREFFTLSDDGYTQKRAVEEIAKADHQRTVNREIGKLGGRPKRTESDTETITESVSESKPNNNPSQTPDTRQDQEQASPDSEIPLKPEIGRMPPSTEAGRACVLMREAGAGITNPSHPDLLAAIAEGVTPETLSATVTEAVDLGKSKPFTWAIATARGRHEQGANQIQTQGASHADHGRTSSASGGKPSLIDRVAAKLKAEVDRSESRRQAAGTVHPAHDADLRPCLGEPVR